MLCQKTKILIVDDEKTVCDVLSDGLHGDGYPCYVALDAKEALTRLAAEDFDLVLLDIKLPDISGMEVLQRIRLNYPYTGVIMITGVNNVDTAVKAMKLGASDYIVKPFDLDRVNRAIRRIIEQK